MRSLILVMLFACCRVMHSLSDHGNTRKQPFSTQALIQLQCETIPGAITPLFVENDTAHQVIAYLHTFSVSVMKRVADHPKDESMSNWLCDLYLDQDDLLSDALMASLDIYLISHERYDTLDYIAYPPSPPS